MIQFGSGLNLENEKSVKPLPRLKCLFSPMEKGEEWYFPHPGFVCSFCSFSVT